MICLPATSASASRPAERLVRRRDEPATERGIGEIAGDAHARASCCPDLLEHVVGIGLLLRQVHDRDVGSLAGERDRGGAADAGVAARHERLPAREPTGAAVGRLTEIGHGRHQRLQPGLLLQLVRRRIDLREARAGIVEGQLVAHHPRLTNPSGREVGGRWEVERPGRILGWRSCSRWSAPSSTAARTSPGASPPAGRRRSASSSAGRPPGSCSCSCCSSWRPAGSTAHRSAGAPPRG